MSLLVKGSKGPEVVKLKQQLNQKLVPSPGLASNDQFDRETELAVFLFQSLVRPRIDVDGKVGDQTWTALSKPGPVVIPNQDESFILFDGRQVYWKVVGPLSWQERAQLAIATGYDDMEIRYTPGRSTSFNLPAVSGPKSHHKKNPSPGTDYTQPQYQHYSGLGPIPEDFYYMNLTPDMDYEQSTGGWGIGGWALYSWSFWRRKMGTAEGHIGDIPGIRSGFFLHEDGGNDGTAGCIGLQRDGVLRMRSQLIQYTNGGYDLITVRVKY